jgi:hypothetical protein
VTSLDDLKLQDERSPARRSLGEGGRLPIALAAFGYQNKAGFVTNRLMSYKATLDLTTLCIDQHLARSNISDREPCVAGDAVKRSMGNIHHRWTAARLAARCIAW